MLQFQPAASGPVGYWTNVTSSFGPSSRYGSSMAYVPELGGILFFGGVGEAHNQTWLYDETRDNWTRLAPKALSPSRAFATMVYDSAARKAILFGGVSASGQPDCGLNDTWLYDPMANTWTNVTSPNAPPGRWDHAMAYDPDGQRAFLFGGRRIACRNWGRLMNDTWMYEATTNTWTNVSSAIAPSARSSTAMAYDPGSQGIVLFSGFPMPYDPGQLIGPPRAWYPGDTWSFRPKIFRWNEVETLRTPKARFGPGIAHDAAAGAIVMYGSCPETSCERDTWWYDARQAEAWVSKTSAQAPPFSPGNAFAYDPRGVLVAYGNSETWEYHVLGNVEPLVVWSSADVMETPRPGAVSFTASITGGVPPFTLVWSFGDGASSSAQNPRHEYSIPGDYKVTVLVTDATGATATSSQVVSIPAPATGSAIAWIPWAIGSAAGAGAIGLVLLKWIRSRRIGRKEP